MKSTKNISLPAFGASKGDYDWPGGAKGGLNSLVKNKLTGELYLISSSPNFNENLKQEDFFISAVFPCKEKRGLVLRDIEVFWNYSSLECYRNTLHEIQDVHEQLKHVVSAIDRKEWGAEIPDPIPPDGLSPDAYALMTAKGFSQNSIRARFGFCREPVFEQTIQDEPSQEIQIFAENLDLLELEFKAPQHDLAKPNEVTEEYRIYDQDKSTPPPFPSESSAEPPKLPEGFSSSKKTINSKGNKKTDNIGFHLRAITLAILLLISISAIYFFIYLIFQVPSTTTHSQAATTRQVDSTSQAVSPEISESFILRTDTYLEIRKEPTMESKIIAKIPESSYIISIKKDYTGQNGSEWSLITLGPYEGWVPKRFLSKITKYQK